VAGGARFVQRPAGGAVELAEDFRVLEEDTGIEHALKFFARRKVVLASILLGAAWGARGP